LGESTAADFGEIIATRLRTEHVALSARWLERLRALLPVAATEIFPSENLLDHIPSLIQEIAAYVQAPGEQAVAANTAVIAKAKELGELRHAQRASIHQLLAEYRLLGAILSSFVMEEFDRLEVSPVARDVIEVNRRLSDALWMLLQTTVDTFISEYTTTIANHTSRLEGFNRMVSHELRQPLATLLYAIPLLKDAVVRADGDKQQHLFDVLERNGRALMDMMGKLELVSRLQISPTETPDVQLVDVAAIGHEVARQLREMAEARGVAITIADELPSITIEVARLELILMNLVSNAIKYSDPAKSIRSVAIEFHQPSEPDFVAIAVRDNGIGIPQASLAGVFSRFVRAHSDRDGELGVSGSGLGLAIVGECVEAIGGRIGIDSREGEGTTVVVTVPRDPARAAGADA
jgi:signal transduction histidine kinase